MKKYINEFKEFINRGNVIDLAVGVIIGSAFSKIVSSLVDDIIMPIVGMIIGGHDFSNLSITFKDANIMYGSFIQNIIDFLIIAVCVFSFVKAINTLATKAKKKEEKKEEKPKKDDQVLLLEEIRDLLKKENKAKK